MNWMIENNEWLDERDFSSHTADGKLRILCERIEESEATRLNMTWIIHTAQMHALAYEKAGTPEQKERELKMLLTVLGAQRYVGERDGYLKTEALRVCRDVLLEAIAIDSELAVTLDNGGRVDGVPHTDSWAFPPAPVRTERVSEQTDPEIDEVVEEIGEVKLPRSESFISGGLRRFFGKKG